MGYRMKIHIYQNNLSNFKASQILFQLIINVVDSVLNKLQAIIANKLVSGKYLFDAKKTSKNTFIFSVFFTN
jgi:hypothetical protein